MQLCRSSSDDACRIDAQDNGHKLRLVFTMISLDVYLYVFMCMCVHKNPYREGLTMRTVSDVRALFSCRPTKLHLRYSMKRIKLPCQNCGSDV